MHLLNNIENIIFDLGGVIIDLDFQGTLTQFSELSGLTPDQVRQRTQGLMLFKDYEKGTMDSAGFRNMIREILNTSAPDSQIDSAWNSLLGGIPTERIQLLRRLKEPYHTFALSNTNEIHVKEFSKIISRSLGSVQSFMDLFQEVYFSHEMKMRKPEPEIYQTLLDAENLVPRRTLFIDDNLENIRSAERLGIQTYHLQDANNLIAVFNGA